jgi:hypothetical protein
MFDKLFSNIRLCGVSLFFNNDVLPNVINTSQLFYDSTITTIPQKIYTSKSTLAFGQESKPSASGVIYTQKAVFSFPTGDAKVSERIAKLQQIRHIEVELTNGQKYIIGRNDFYQNARPEIEVQNTENTVQVSITSLSMFPIGFLI